MKITIIGNSVALRVRPTPKIRNTRVYGSLLEEIRSQYVVRNLSKSRYLTSEFLFDEDEFIRTFPDYFVINLGCVDAPPRDIPLWFSDVIFKRRFLSFYNFFKFIYKLITYLNLRKLLVYCRFKKSWVPINKFRKNIKYIITTLKKETNANIIVLGINSGNERLEKLLPGILDKYSNYNICLKEITLEEGEYFLDVSDLSSAQVFPDGVHYNLEGHKIIANRILEFIDSEK